MTVADSPDPVAAYLAGVRERMGAVPETARAHPVWAAATSAADVPRLLAALDAVLALHQPNSIEPPYCWGDDLGWPCPTCEAISVALTGEGS